MKKRILYPIGALIIAVCMPSCEKLASPEKEAQQLVLRKKSAEIIEADLAFGFELFDEVLDLSDAENIMISPMSVSYALGMTYNGAAGSTLDAFSNVLHFDGLSNEEVNESYKDLMDQLLKLDDQVDFSLANSIWYRMGYQVLDDFIQTNQDYFDAEVKEADFGDPGTVDQINAWIEGRTNGKITDMLDDIPVSAVMYLINAIYFNAPWKYEFEKEATYRDDFQLEDGGTVQADFMKVSGDFAYISNEEFTAVELPYGDSAFSMVVLQPAGDLTVGQWVDGMDAASWKEVAGQCMLTGVEVHLPKFKYGFKDLLNDPLKNMGLGIAFGGEADFTRINPGGEIYISRVIHQTFIDVQEEGTEAAAATIVELREDSSAGGGGVVIFKVDRPFFYVIKENSSGAIVFMGKTGRPVYN